jgi:hypothetical protein
VQWLEFERLRWDRGKPETAHYECVHCGGVIEEHHKTAILQVGEWRATAGGTDPGTIGFHLSALYSPVGWLSWLDIARIGLRGLPQPREGSGAGFGQPDGVALLLGRGRINVALIKLFLMVTSFSGGGGGLNRAECPRANGSREVSRLQCPALFNNRYPHIPLAI